MNGNGRSSATRDPTIPNMPVMCNDQMGIDASVFPVYCVYINRNGASA